MREINRRPVAPLTKGNAAEGELMLSIYQSDAICNKHKIASSKRKLGCASAMHLF